MRLIKKLNIIVVISVLLVNIISINSIITFAADGYYKITWNTYGDYYARVYFVDSDGNNLTPNADGLVLTNIEGTSHVDIASINEFLPISLSEDNWVCNYAYVIASGAPTYIGRLSYNHIGHTTADPEHWHYFNTKTNKWIQWNEKAKQKYVDLYVVLTQLVDNDIHESIEINLYNYGSAINSVSNKALHFVQASAKHSGIDGWSAGIPAGTNTSTSSAAPKIKKFLTNGVPTIIESAGYSGSLEYLFYQSGADYRYPSDGWATYQDPQTGATWTADGDFNTKYTSIRYNLEGDGGYLSRLKQVPTSMTVRRTLLIIILKQIGLKYMTYL